MLNNFSVIIEAVTLFRVALGGSNFYQQSNQGTETAGSAAVQSNRQLQADLSRSMNVERKVYREEQSFRDQVRRENTLYTAPDSDLDTQQKANAYVSGISRFLF